MARGHDRERRVRQLLEDDGWVVVRAAGSLGECDLVAMQYYQALAAWTQDPVSLVRMIEVKSTSRPYERFEPADRIRLLDAAQRAGASAWLAWWPKNGQLKWVESKDWPSNG